MIIRNRTSCRPIWSVIILVINQIGWPHILLITRMIADQIGLHSVLLSLLIIQVINKIGQQHSESLICLITSMITDWIGQYNNKICDFSRLRKRPTFLDAITGFPAKLHLGNERRNSILMMRYWPDLGSASDGLKNLFQPIRGTTQIWVLMGHQYGISVLVSKTSFREETSSGVVKCWLFSLAMMFQAFFKLKHKIFRELAVTKKCDSSARAWWNVLCNYLDMMYTVLFHCPINAEIRTATW